MTRQFAQHFFQTLSALPRQASARERALPFARPPATAFRERLVPGNASATFARFDGCCIARDVPDQALLLGAEHQRFLQTLGQIRFRKLSERSRERGLMWNLTRAVPTAQQPQLAVGSPLARGLQTITSVRLKVEQNQLVDRVSHIFIIVRWLKCL